MIRFIVEGLPAVKGNMRANKFGRMYDANAKEIREWARLVLAEAVPLAPPEPWAGPVELRVTFRLPVPQSAPKTRRLWMTKRPDTSKLLRAIEDILTDTLWLDDSQIVRHGLAKDYAYDGPVGVTVEAEELVGEPTAPDFEALLLPL